MYFKHSHTTPITHDALSVTLILFSSHDFILSPLEVHYRLLGAPKRGPKRKHKALLTCPLTSMTAFELFLTILMNVVHISAPTDRYLHLCRKWLVLSLSADLQPEVAHLVPPPHTTQVKLENGKQLNLSFTWW